MSGLFLRIWLTSTVLCLTALIVEDYVVWDMMEAHDVYGADAYLAGGARLARDYLDATPAADEAAALAELSDVFSMPATLVRLDAVPSEVREQFAPDAPFAFVERVNDFEWFVELDDGARALRLGPSRWEEGTPTWVLDFVLIGLLVALALALALGLVMSPLIRERRAVKAAAGAISAGDFSVRVGELGSTSADVANAFDTMATRTEGLILAQRHLLHAVSHELRTPIARLRLGIHLLNTPDAEARDRKELELDADIEDLDDLVAELLTYARLEGTTADPTAAKLALPAVRERIERLRATAMHATVELDTDLEDAQTAVAVEPTSLARALDNLLTNALRHANTRVRVSVSARDGGVAVAVEDDGAGVPKADRAQVFEPFVRLEGAVGDGYGMGLAIVARICQRHGGALSVDDSELGGARFTSWFPAPLPPPVMASP